MIVKTAQVEASMINPSHPIAFKATEMFAMVAMIIQPK